ncbi:hypothetical protein TRFO_19061 [Tritrichomonas foetus]|uniref:Uncharacterized protein n=1 Tax=Tritrichomonas foetus TaxID=1144522 RepID=A0A1J4KKH5_9EUKA|nr:hypothetical protein TRFO_19061 [Tritrichomonas foetus]|eukprot:OHT11432.1 hypothetical protein TRFO_19061 [Tritrichomonas foetus]
MIKNTTNCFHSEKIDEFYINSHFGISRLQNVRFNQSKQKKLDFAMKQRHAKSRFTSKPLHFNHQGLNVNS